jgi:hypothetical protein
LWSLNAPPRGKMSCYEFGGALHCFGERYAQRRQNRLSVRRN